VLYPIAYDVISTMFRKAFRYPWLVAVATLAGFSTAEADSMWVCSIVDKGKPQVIQHKVGKEGVAVRDWIGRLAEEFGGPDMNSPGPDIYTPSLKVVEDNARGLIAFSAGTASEAGQPSNYSSRMLIINKWTGDLSDTMLSTLSAPVETKGTCVGPGAKPALDDRR
jgi:hypothetical protein